MMKAYWKDIWRSVKNGKKRFISIALIAALGVTMMCGLRASCEDLRHSADEFFDEQNLFDIRVLSTLGLTDEDVEAIEALSEVESADGGYNETIHTQVEGMRKSIDIRTLSEKNFNQPYLVEGRLPEREDEIAITENFVNQSGKGLGDRIALDKESENLKSTEFIITGIIIDPLDINSSEGAMGFRSTSSTDYVGYVTPDAADYDVYTVVYLALDGTKEMNCYTDGYERQVEAVVDKIETKIKSQREQARFDEVYDDAMDEWLDGEREMKEEFAKADQEIADAKQELSDGKEEMEKSRKKLEDGRQELEDGRQELDAAKSQLEGARSELESGRKEIAEGEAELNSKEQQADARLASAKHEIQSGYAEIADGESKLQAAKEELEAGQKQLDAGKEELTGQQQAAEAQFAAARQELEEKEAEVDAVYQAQKQQYDETLNTVNPQIDLINAMLEDPEVTEEQKIYLQGKLAELQGQIAAAEQTLAAVEQQLLPVREQIAAGKAELEAREAAAKKQFDAAWTEIEKNQAELDTGWQQYEEKAASLESAKAKLAAGETELEKQEASAKSQIADGRSQLVIGKQELLEGERELAAAEQKIADSEKELSDGEQELTDGEQKLADGEQELADGEQELAENIAEYRREKEKAERELADAKEKIDDIDMTKWYVQNRGSLSGYANIESDAASIQAIGDVFPILFLTVAILISLTTITRMVEEERGLIGTYKALGFSNGEIRRKYMIYAATACLMGGLLGDIGGYIILPTIIFIVFRVMYVLPEYAYQFDLLYGFGGMLLFEAGVLSATVYTCKRTLSKMPAKLMRPKSPKAGSRVLLERVTFIWKRLSFLNKVTARNLFRYKKRLLMTVFGIMGCTALLLVGFTIKNTVSEMMPQQYQNIYRYDLMVVSDDDEFEKLEETMENDSEIADYISARIESVEVLNAEGAKETIQLIAAAKGESLDDYICLKNENDEEFHLKDGEFYITNNASNILNFQEGDTVTLQNLDLVEVEATVDHIVENYMGNTIYMTESTYEELFGTCQINGVLANFSENYEDQSAYTDALARADGILSAMSTRKMEEEFEPAFALINMVVYVVLVLAAMLAFVVLFTLSNTNISERERELATIKVLGFYHPEVHAYVNKETLILTAIGILCGMPAGYALGSYIMGILRFPSLEFYIILYPESYLIAGATTMLFALIVNVITNRTLDKINMVEALKSVE